MHGIEAPVLGKKQCNVSQNMPLQRVFAVKNKLKCTVNDLLVGVVGVAFQRYFLQHQSQTSKISIPDNIKVSSKNIMHMHVCVSKFVYVCANECTNEIIKS